MRKLAVSFVFALVLGVFGSIPAFGQQYCQDQYGNVFPCPPPPQPPFGQPWPYPLPGNSPLAQQLNNTNAFVQGITDNALIVPLTILGNQLGNAIRNAQPQYYPQYPQYPGYYPQPQYGQQVYPYQQQPQYPQGPYYYPQGNQYPQGYYPQQQLPYGAPQQGQPYVMVPQGVQPPQYQNPPYPYQQQRIPQRPYRRMSQNEHIDLRDLVDGAGNVVYASTGNPRAASAVSGAGQIINFVKEIHDQREDARKQRAEDEEYQRQVAAEQAAAAQQAQALQQLAAIESQKLALAQQQAQNRPPQGPPQYPQPQYGPQHQQFVAPQPQQKLHATFRNCLLKGAVLVHVTTDAGEETEFVIISDNHFQTLCHLPNREGVKILNDGHLNSFRNWDHMGPISSITATLCGFDGEKPIPVALNPSGEVVFSNLIVIKDKVTGQPVSVPCTQSQQGSIVTYSFYRPVGE